MFDLKWPEYKSNIFNRALKCSTTLILTLLIAVPLSLSSLQSEERSTPKMVIPDASKHDITYEEEYQAFEKELISSIPEVQKRTKRFVYLNSDTYVAVALLIGVPLTLVLPSLSNIFNKWRKRRSVFDEEEQYYGFEDDPTIQPQLDKISTYFRLVDIPEHSCQLRAICEFSADPEKYYPLSEMILSRIRNPHLPAMVYFENENGFNHNVHSKMVDKSKSDINLNTTTTSGSGTNSTDAGVPVSLFKIYSEAADTGLHGKNRCETVFGDKCQYSMDKLLNMPTLRFWTAMQRFLKLRFTDGGSSF